MFTTLNQIRDNSPCTGGWKKLLASLNKTQADDEPLNISAIIDSNGLNDALWALRAVDGKDKEIRLYGVWCARQVQHLMTDQRSLNALDVAERFANGEATTKELYVARSAACAATTDSAWDSTEAARSAVGAACATARSAAWCAADAAAWYANGEAAQEARLREICAN